MVLQRDRNINLSGISSKRIKVDEDNNWRPWSELPEDLLDLISKRLGVIDYLMFCCVCKTWRSFAVVCKEDFMASQPPLVLLMSTHAKRSCYFYSLFDKRLYKTTLPNLTGKKCSGFSCGYLIMLDKDYVDKQKVGTNSEIWLVNPFTRHELRFPSPPHRFCDIILASLDIPHPEFVIVAFSNVFTVLQFCRSGDVNWTVFEYDNNTVDRSWMIIDVTVFKGKIYVLTSHAEIGILNLNSDPMVTLLDVKSIEISSRFLRLVASGEQLLVVDFRPECRPYAEPSVYRLDFSRMKLLRVNLGDQALFLGELNKCSGLITRNGLGGSRKGQNFMYLIGSSTGNYYVDGRLVKRIPLTRKDGNPNISIGTSIWYFPHLSCNIDSVLDD